MVMTLKEWAFGTLGKCSRQAAQMFEVSNVTNRWAGEFPWSRKH